MRCALEKGAKCIVKAEEQIVGVVRTHLPFVSKPSGSRPAQSWLACAARIEGAARLRSKACYKAGSPVRLASKALRAFEVRPVTRLARLTARTDGPVRRSVARFTHNFY